MLADTQHLESFHNNKKQTKKKKTQRKSAHHKKASQLSHNTKELHQFFVKLAWPVTSFSVLYKSMETGLTQ